MTAFQSWDIIPHLVAVRAEIIEACTRAGRNHADISIVAVTKGHAVERVKKALMAGLADLGESRVQELSPKARLLADQYDILFKDGVPRWHFIGHLQRNKVREVLPLLTCLHSLDSQRLLATIEREYERLVGRHGKAAIAPLPCYLEVNVEGDPAKHGVSPEGLTELLQAAYVSKAVTVRGLMTVAPKCEDAETVRPHFRALARMAKDHRLTGLSMGMTDDYHVAVEEGATVVRIGRGLFAEQLTGAR